MRHILLALRLPLNFVFSDALSRFVIRDCSLTYARSHSYLLPATLSFSLLSYWAASLTASCPIGESNHVSCEYLSCLLASGSAISASQPVVRGGRRFFWSVLYEKNLDFWCEKTQNFVVIYFDYVFSHHEVNNRFFRIPADCCITLRSSRTTKSVHIVSLN